MARYAIDNLTTKIEDTKLELLREIEEYLLSRKFSQGSSPIEEVLEDLCFREIGIYVDKLWGRILDLEQDLMDQDTLAYVRRKRLDIENSAIAKEALSRVR